MLNVQVYAEGTHLIILWFERPVIYDVCAKPHVAESTSGCRDLRMKVVRIMFLKAVVALELLSKLCRVF